MHKTARCIKAFAIVASGIGLAACISLQPEPLATPAVAPMFTAIPKPPNTPQPPPTLTPLSGNCASGECLPVGDLPGWRQIFSDDFAGTVALGEWSGCSLEPFICNGLPESYRADWWAYTEGWPDTSKNGTYSSSKVLSVADGVLDMYVHTEHGVHLVVAPVPLIHGREGPLGQLYGRYVVRFRADSLLHGYKIAWLLWPDSETWPRDGEIDFPEGNLDASIEGYMHRQDAAVGNDQEAFFSGVPISGSWHTAIIEWMPESIRFILDGQLIGTSTSRIPNTPMHWVLQTETNLDGYEPSDNVGGHVLIDWVAVYAPRE